MRKVAIDLDGVLANYSLRLRQIAEREFLRPFGEPKEWGFADWGLPESGFWKLHQKLVASGGFSSLKPYEGAVEAVQALKNAGWYIIISTNRSSFTAMQDTHIWLMKHNVPFDSIVFGEDKTLVSATIYIDDNPKVLQAYADRGFRYAVCDHAYNRHVQGPRVSSMAEFANKVLEG